MFNRKTFKAINEINIEMTKINIGLNRLIDDLKEMIHRQEMAKMKNCTNCSHEGICVKTHLKEGDKVCVYWGRS